MKERTIVSTFALLGSLSAYYYAKHQTKDPTPLLMLGGFVGALFGEVVSQVVNKDGAKKSSSGKSTSVKELE